MNCDRSYRVVPTVLALTLMMSLVGCDGDTGSVHANADSERSRSLAALPQGVFVASPPGEPAPIADLKASAKEDDEVVVRVVIGGREYPIAENLAVLTVVDADMFSKCLTHEHDCSTPGCEPSEQLMKHLATIQLVDDQGHPLAIDLSSSQLKPMMTIVVKGQVGPRINADTLIVHADAIFVENPS